MKFQRITNTILPIIMNGIKDQNGPIPKNFAHIGEITATVIPVDTPQVMTETIKIIFTIEPVISVLPNGDVTACITISKAVRAAVLVIHKTFLFITICTPFM